MPTASVFPSPHRLAVTFRYTFPAPSKRIAREYSAVMTLDEAERFAAHETTLYAGRGNCAIIATTAFLDRYAEDVAYAEYLLRTYDPTCESSDDFFVYTKALAQWDEIKAALDRLPSAVAIELYNARIDHIFLPAVRHEYYITEWRTSCRNQPVSPQSSGA